ncbi:MAG: hypothetical protein ACOCX5_01245 [Chloroflexota bacterium]
MDEQYDNQGRHTNMGPQNSNQRTAYYSAQQRNVRSRRALYTLIVRFRRISNHAEDMETRTIYAFAAEVISGLTRALRQFENRHHLNSLGDNPGNVLNPEKD